MKKWKKKGKVRKQMKVEEMGRTFNKWEETV